jgi:hypothetical protein
MNNLNAFSKLAFEVFYLNRKRQDVFIQEVLELGFEVDVYTGKRMVAGTSIAAITNLWFGSLRGFSANGDEKRIALLVGALTPIYDDLLDIHGFKDLAEESFDQLVADKAIHSGNNKALYDLFHWLMLQSFEKLKLID